MKFPNSQEIVDWAKTHNFKFKQGTYQYCLLKAVSEMTGVSPAILEVNFPGISAGFDGFRGNKNYEFGNKMWALVNQEGLV